MTVEPIAIEIDDADGGLLAFVSWVEAKDEIKVFFGPDVIMAIDTPEQRGWFFHEIYFAVAWIDRGEDAFIAQLGSRSYHRRPGHGKLSPEEWLELIVRKGKPIQEVRHLI